ncbi:hypothetical protein ACH6EH_10340 [Paenibacillus sp. JSM ZJ436]
MYYYNIAILRLLLPIAGIIMILIGTSVYSVYKALQKEVVILQENDRKLEKIQNNVMTRLSTSLMVLAVAMMLAGCAKGDGHFIVQGKIEDISSETGQILVDGFWLPVREHERFMVGEYVIAEIESRAPGDSYDPDLTTVRRIERGSEASK